MQPTDAVELINMIPRHGYIEMRGGYELFCTVPEGDGTEKITNGTFATDTDWSKNANWSIGSGVATHSTGAADYITQTIASGLIEGAAYALEYDISGRTGGTVQPLFSGVWGIERDANGTNLQEAIICESDSGAASFAFYGSTDFDGSIDNVSLQLIDSDIDFVKEFYDGSTRKLLAASPTNVYDITSGTGTSLVGSMTNGRWMATMHNGTMIFVNGADAPQTYDGTTWSAATISGSGLTVADLIGCHTHKNRGYYWEKDNQSFWYAAANTLAGTLTEFTLGRVAKKGGKLLKMETWTVDGGAGPDDYAVFIMDSGEVIVYQGSDPGSALSWALVGIYDVGEMFNNRLFAKYGGKILAVAAGDLITMPEAFSAAAMPATKISNAMTKAITRFDSNNGWELFIIPNEHLLIINVPTSISPDLFDQYVQNMETGAFCRFTNMNARTWGMYNTDAYYGSSGDGKIFKFNSVDADNTDTDIDVTISNAWNDLGMPENKMVTTVRPVFEAEGDMPVAVDVAYDFVEPSVSSPSSSSSGGTPWGSPWGSPWSTPTGITGSWRTVNGRGSATGLRIKFSRQGDRPKLYKTDALVKPEGNLW
jgi:hypothetical protein